MIAYDLCCEHDHSFEAWFKDAATFERQAKRKLLSCAICGSPKVKRALSAPAIAGTRSQNSAAVPAKAYATHPDAAKMAALMAQLGELRKQVEANADNVGEKFAEEARKIFHKESPERAIRGTASREETEELLEEGIPVMPLPVPPQSDWH